MEKATVNGKCVNIEYRTSTGMYTRRLNPLIEQ